MDPKAFNTTVLAYEGYFKSSRLDGEGKAVLYSFINSSLNGDLHKGTFEKDLEHGKGVKTYLNHQSLASFEGDWVRGSMNG